MAKTVGADNAAAPQARENFRQNSFFSDLAVGVISGLGAYSYELALRAAFKHLETDK